MRDKEEVPNGPDLIVQVPEVNSSGRKVTDGQIRLMSSYLIRFMRETVNFKGINASKYETKLLPLSSENEDDDPERCQEHDRLMEMSRPEKGEKNTHVAKHAGIPLMTDLTNKDLKDLKMNVTPCNAGKYDITGKRCSRLMKAKVINGHNFNSKNQNTKTRPFHPVNVVTSNPLKISTEAPEAYFSRMSNSYGKQ